MPEETIKIYKKDKLKMMNLIQDYRSSLQTKIRNGGTPMEMQMMVNKFNECEEILNLNYLICGLE